MTSAMPTRSPAAATAPLTPEQMAAIQLAHTRSAKLRRAANVATIDATVMAIFTAVCFASAVFDPKSGLLLGMALGVVTYNSFRGAAGLRRFDRAAPRLLAWNQLLLAVSVIIYAAISLYVAMHTPMADDPNFKQLMDVDREMGKFLADTSALIFEILYISLIAGTVVAQGLTGWYYASRGKLLEAYLAQTPPWVLDLQRHQAK